MQNLSNSPFFKCIHESISALKNPAPETLMGYYEDFFMTLMATVEKEDSTIPLFRHLRFMHIEIYALRKLVRSSDIDNSFFLETILWKALGLIDVELDVVRLKIEQHGLTLKTEDPGGESPVFWSKKYSVTDLIELIVALCESGALVFRDGSKIGYAALVRLFERTFNVTIKDPRGLKSNVTSRKIKATKFLDVLSSNFVELCNH
jgi:hypothetical protein